MKIKKYFVATVPFLITAGEALILLTLIQTNIKAPQGSVFTLKTIAPLIAGIISSFMAFGISLPYFKTLVYEKGINKNQQTILWLFLIILSLSLCYASIMVGGTDYTQFQSQMYK